MKTYTNIIEVLWNEEGNPEVRGAGLPTLKPSSLDLGPFMSDLEIRIATIRLYRLEGWDVRDADFNIEKDEESDST